MDEGRVLVACENDGTRAARIRPRRDLLDRLLALNHQRHAEELEPGPRQTTMW